MNTAIISSNTSFITPLPLEGYNSALKGTDSESVVEHLNKKVLNPSEGRQNNNTLAAQAENNTVGSGINNPDLAKPSVEANPKLLEQQLALLGAVLSDVKPQERNQVFSDVADNFSVEAKRAGFDINTINSSSAGQFAHMLTLLIQVALDARESTADMANMGRELAHDNNRASSKKTVEAAEARMTQAITTGVTSTAIAGAGGVRSAQGLNTQSTALKNHGMKALDFKAVNKGNEMTRQGVTPGMVNDPTRKQDASHISSSSDKARQGQDQHEIHQERLKIVGQQQQGQGGVATASAAGIGNVAGAPLYVDIGENDAAASNLNTDKDMHLSASEASKRMADQEGKLKDELVQLMHEVVKARNDNISAMASNIRG